MTTRTVVKLPVNGKTVTAAVALLGSAALLVNMGAEQSSARPLFPANGRLGGTSDIDRANDVMDRMLTVAVENDRELMKSAHLLDEGYYVQMGTPGICVDSNAQPYDYASYTKNNVKKCAQFCGRQLLYSEHHGFNYNAATQECHCLFDDHRIPRPVQKKADFVIIQPNGVGEVKGTDASGDNAAFTCHKKSKEMVGSALDNYVNKRCDVDDGQVLDYVAFTAFEPEPCAELCARFSMLKTHRGFSVTIEGHCRCLFKEGEVPTERKLSNSGADRFDGGYTFQQRFQQFLTPADTKCYDTIDRMTNEPASKRLAADPNNHVFINEFHFRNLYTNEPFIRIVGPKGTDASKYAIVSYQGRDGTAFQQTPLTGTFDSPDNHPTFGYVKVDLPTSAVRNGKQGADGFALANTETGACLQFISYASEAEYQRSFMATSGLCVGTASNPLPAGVTEPRETPLGESLQLTGSGNVYDAFAWTGPADAATGTANAGQTLTSI